jgi:hyperosmotically inducible periplasmic protein
MKHQHAHILAALACMTFAGVVFAEDTGNAVDDSYITAKVKAELTADSATKARHISVKTKRGVVALTGRVDSRGEKQKAEQDARDVKGVVDVINKLEVND